jgi:DNA-binding MarR family transcriptional regulator
VPKLKFDIECPNFDYAFDREAENMGPNERGQLPKELLFKIFRRGAAYDAKSTSKLGFLGKLYILLKSLNKRWILLVEDQDRGLTEGQFLSLKETIKKEGNTIEAARELISSGTFVLGGKELMDAYARLNNLSISPAYNFLVKNKNQNKSKILEYTSQMEYICRFLSFYESKKKKWVMSIGVSMPEFLVLSYIYHGREVVSSQIYKEVYKYAYNSSSTQIKLAFGSLQRKGFVEKIGVKKGVKIRITAAGSDMVNEIISKYAVNC